MVKCPNHHDPLIDVYEIRSKHGALSGTVSQLVGWCVMEVYVIKSGVDIGHGHFPTITAPFKFIAVLPKCIISHDDWGRTALRDIPK